MSFVVFIIPVFLFPGAFSGNDFSKLSETGVLARIDLLNSLKIAINLSKTPLTTKERLAATEFAKFLNLSRSDDYLEAFYAPSNVNHVNKFLQFLNGIVYDGDPSLPIWRAAETIIKMIKTKSNVKELENLRKEAKTAKVTLLKTPTQPKKIGNIDSSHLLVSRKKYDNIDYVQLFKKPQVFLLKSIIASVNDSNKN